MPECPLLTIMKSHSHYYKPEGADRTSSVLAIIILIVFLGAAFTLIASQPAFAAEATLPSMPIPPGNPITDAKVKLGRQLYFDGRLSADDKISCATCHNPATGWAGHDPTDTGIRRQVGNRNSGTIVNSGYMKYQFWDGRAASLEEQALGPIHNPIEMGETLENVVRKLNAIPGYKQQFQEVFHSDVTADGIAKAIAAFERTIVSGPSPYDRAAAGDKNVLTPEAQRGMQIFFGKGGCVSCHGGPFFSDQSFHNIGVGMDAAKPDIGREAVTKDPADHGRFKTPGLRNVANTFPYMHDGKTPTLEAVVQFYNKGGIPNSNLDPLIKPLGLSETEQKDLIAFLNALTGYEPIVAPPQLP